MKRVLGGALAFAFALAAPQPAAAAPPDASFAYSPAAPLTLEPVTFQDTSTGDVSGIAWDLDNDGFFDDGTAPTATLTFPSAGFYTVRLRAVGPGGSGEQTQYVRVANRPPTAAFTHLPATPQAGDAVSFVALAQDPDGSVVSQQWDLDGDGAFEASGPLASHVFPAAGDYTVRLRVLDDDQAAAETTQQVHVDPKPPQFLSPFPLVRISGGVSVAGSRIRRLVVEAPPGARVEVRCHGRGCKLRRQVRRAPAKPGARGPVRLRFRRFERRLRPGAVVEILVTKPGTIGKYTRLEMRRRRQPRRTDLCIFPGAERPRSCGS